MTTFADPAPVPRLSWLGRAEAWMDDRGKGAWIAATVLGFILFWPLGLAVLGYLILTKRLGRGKCAARRGFGPATFRSSGNTAFDAYKAETLRRLEDEQEAFESFLERLRAAKDKAEFDQFMEDRARKSGSAETSDTDKPEPAEA